jgi:hypothetical protein
VERRELGGKKEEREVRKMREGKGGGRRSDRGVKEEVKWRERVVKEDRKRRD